VVRLLPPRGDEYQNIRQHESCSLVFYMVMIRRNCAVRLHDVSKLFGGRMDLCGPAGTAYSECFLNGIDASTSEKSFLDL